jgi:hypothetical protein
VNFERERCVRMHALENDRNLSNTLSFLFLARLDAFSLHCDVDIE